MFRIVLATNEIKIDLGATAKLLGPHCTPGALQQNLKKLKRIGREEAAAAAAAAAAGAGMEAASPRKEPGRAKLAASKKPKQRKIIKAEPKEESKEKIKEEVEESQTDDESDLPSPAKRPRKKSALKGNGHGEENGLLPGLC